MPSDYLTPTKDFSRRSARSGTTVLAPKKSGKPAFAQSKQATPASSKVSKPARKHAPVASAPTCCDSAEKGPPMHKNGEEKRPRVFRKHAPQSYLQRLERAVSQRLGRPCFGIQGRC